MTLHHSMCLKKKKSMFFFTWLFRFFYDKVILHADISNDSDFDIIIAIYIYSVLFNKFVKMAFFLICNSITLTLVIGLILLILYYAW